MPFPHNRSLAVLPVILCIFLAHPLPRAAAVEIFYSVSGDLVRADLASDQATTIYSGPQAGRPMVPAVLGNTLYWTTYYPGQLRTSDLDGNGVSTLVDQGDTTTRAIQFHEGQIYWANEPLGAVYRSNLDGTNVETVISGYFGYEDGIWDFEIYNERIYWVGWDTDKVSSTALDGSDFQSFSPGLTRGFSLEAANDRLYISDNQNGGNGRIVSTALDGTDLTVLTTGSRPLSLSILGDRIYYNDSESHNIYSLPLTGGMQTLEFVTQELPVSWQLTAIVPEPSRATLLLFGVLAAIQAVTRRRLTA